MLKPDPTDERFLAWAAAWLDTEGHIGLRSGKQNRRRTQAVSFRVHLGISQVDPAPLVLLQTAFGGSVYKSTPSRGRPIHQWFTHSRNAAEFLRAVRPFLIVKVKQADAALEAANIISSGIRGRWHKRGPAEVAVLQGLKTKLNDLNGWSPERIERASVITKRRGPQPLSTWSAKHAHCDNCQQTVHPHAGRGLCRNCYGRHWRQHVQGRPARKPVAMRPPAV